MPDKINYQKLMDSELDNLSHQSRTPRLLLHACCAPCSSSVLECLVDHFQVDLFFYNPNIAPADEYKKRLDQIETLLTAIGIKDRVHLIDSSYDHHRFDTMSLGLENESEGGRRCSRCFELRLAETGKTANQLGYDYFCSTLTVSPHKNAQLINQIGHNISQSGTAKWLYSDFKKREGYKRSIVLSKEIGLYRQDYCGCLYSKN